MIQNKPDGRIELKNSSCGCCPPPGHEGEGMHTNTTSTWWRVDEEEWNRIEKEVSPIHIHELAVAARDCAEFKGAVEE